MSKAKRALSAYVTSAEDLADIVKQGIQHGVTETVLRDMVLALNKFTIASNNIKDTLDEIKKDEPKTH